MAEQQALILQPETMIEEFKKNGVTHIITIPDSETNYLYELMLQESWLDVVPVSREGETMGVALGLNVAGNCLLYTSPSPRDGLLSRMPSSA